MDEWIPWCTRASDFERHHILFRVRQPERYWWIWQHWDRDGDYVRSNYEARYRSSKTPPEYYPAWRVEGYAGVDGIRGAIVRADGSFLLYR